jgi:carboxypeptidase PM20D1
MKHILTALALALLVTLAVVCVRGLTFTSRQISVVPALPFELQRDAVAKRLSQAIQHRTLSYRDLADPSHDEFERFHGFLAGSFPRVHQRLARESVDHQSLLYTWKGKNGVLKPILLMAHMDVVPVDAASESLWKHPPFSGAVADGFVWGRGTMDDKASVLGVLEAVEHLLKEGFLPERTVYLAFGHDEEIGGQNGAAKIAELLHSRRVELEFVLDEGMNILSGIIDGISSPVALIGIAEKGYLSIRLTAEGAGGHSSLPPADSAIGVLSRALQRIETAPFPSRLNGSTRQMFEYLGPEMPWPKKLALANLWLFDPLIRRQLVRSPLTNAAIRTTVAPTILTAGVQENVLPTKATAVINLRILPGETIAGTLEHVRKAVDDPKVQLTALPVQMEPSAVSSIESPSFQLLQRTIGQTVPETIVAPALLVAATDSRHYAGLTKNIFRFLPITLRPEDTKRYHGIDERISIDDYERCIRFYAQLIRNSQ